MSGNPLDTAWKIHAAVVDWTGKVDSKASFASAIESGLMVGIIAATRDDGPLAHRDTTWERWLFWLGVAVLGGSAGTDANLQIDEDSKGKILRLALDDGMRKMLPQVDKVLLARGERTAKAEADARK